jgi:hypothetical protein
MRIKPICFFIFAIAITCTASLTGANAQSMDESVAILANGTILTMIPNQPSVSAMAVKGGIEDLNKLKRNLYYNGDKIGRDHEDLEQPINGPDRLS